MNAMTGRLLRQVAAATVLAIAGPALAQTSFGADPFADAYADASVRSFVSGTTVRGGSLRAAVWQIPQQGFPTEGASYVVVSSGDANFIGAPDRSSACGADPYGKLDPTDAVMFLCGLGGFVSAIDLPPSADKLSFSYTYFTTDFYGDPLDAYRSQDPFRVFLVARGAAVLQAESTVSVKDSGLAFGERTEVTIDVSQYAGEQISLQFLAANQWDRSLPSGALVDGLALTLKPTNTVGMTIASPLDGDWVRGSTPFAADVSSTSDMASVTFTIDAQTSFDGTAAAAAVAPASSWGATFDTSRLADGTHLLDARAVTIEGLTATAATAFRVDNTRPSLRITSPAPGDYVRDTIAITAVADDGDVDTVASGVESIVLRVNGRVLETCALSFPQGAARCSATLDTNRLQGGPFIVSAEAVDRVGNAEFARVSAISDNITPAKFLVSPLPGQLASTSVDVSVSVRDQNFAEVSCTLDGNAVFDVTVPVFTETVSLLDVLDGTHTVSCLAQDLAGNGGAESADFVVKNWTESLHPQTLNLASKGGDRSVTLYVEGPGVDLLLPLAERIALAVAGAPPIPASWAALGDENGNGLPDLTVKFDRQALIAAAKLAGATSARPLRVGFTVDGKEFGSALLAVLAR
jgi:Bacterial Ig domain